MALSFNGTADILTAGVGSQSAAGAVSLAVACRINEDTERAGIMSLFTSGNAEVYGFYRRDSGSADPGTLCYSAGGSNSRAVTFLTADGWCVVGMSKATGSAVPQFHKVPIPSGSSTHANSGSTVGNGGGTPSATKFAAWGDSNTSQFSSLDIICAAFWTSQLSDANFDTLKNGFSAWTTLSPVDMWTLNSLSTINDSVGSANETSRVGTTVISDPSPFATGSLAPSMGQVLRSPRGSILGTRRGVGA
jgi:hypothetical protein